LANWVTSSNPEPPASPAMVAWDSIDDLCD
ncbi:hypothetical protein Tco_1537757, partial [Tanacetum coccineum]